MILDALATALVTLLTGMLALFPAYTLDVPGLGGTLGSAIAGANAVFPVTTLGFCLSAVIGARVFIAVVAFTVWVWTKIPFLMR